MILWTAEAAADATGGELKGTNWHATGVCIDTREIKKGDLFIALTDSRDGHDFVAEAFAKGASAALVSRVPNGCDGKNLLIVDDVLKGLGDMARYARARTEAKIIGITGSVGKTSCKEMLRLVLSAQGATHAAERSFNNHWGVPLTLARMPQDTDFAVIEIGMNHAGEIAPLAKMARLDVALITTVGAVHLAAFDSVEEIAQEKAEIFSGLKSGGFAVLNRDIETWDVLSEKAKSVGAKIISFGTHKNANFRLETGGKFYHNSQSIYSEYNGILFYESFLGQSYHMSMNICAVLASMCGLGADLKDAILKLELFCPLEGRGEHTLMTLENGQEATLIDESYNANPLSMKAVLEHLAEGIEPTGKGRKVAIIGDMLELGKDEKTFHRDIADLPCIKKIDIIHTIGTLMKNLHDALPEDKRGVWMQDADECIAKSQELIQENDIVMMKGSFSIGLGKVVKHLTKNNKPQVIYDYSKYK